MGTKAANSNGFMLNAPGTGAVSVGGRETQARRGLQSLADENSSH
jgi:hypothetical protein